MTDHILTTRKELEDNISPGYNYLPKTITDSINLKLRYKRGALVGHPLIADIVDYSFKRSTNESSLTRDDVSAKQRNRICEEQSILGQIKDIHDSGTATDAMIFWLHEGMSGNPKFLEVFPYAKIHLNGHLLTEHEADIQMIYDERRLFNIQAIVDGLLHLWDRPVSLFETNHLSGEFDDSRSPELAKPLSDSIKELHSVVFSRIPLEDLEYYLRWLPVITEFPAQIPDNVLGYGYRVVSASALPMRVYLKLGTLNGKPNPKIIQIIKFSEFGDEATGIYTMDNPCIDKD